MRVAGTLSVVVTLALSSACLAGSQNISAQLRDQAVQNCTGDAMRLCLASILDEEQTTQCMETNRSQLSPQCRATMDRGSHKTKRRSPG